MGAKTSTSATASSFSCKRPEVKPGRTLTGPRTSAFLSYLSAQGQNGRLEQLRRLLPAHVTACGRHSVSATLTLASGAGAATYPGTACPCAC